MGLTRHYITVFFTFICYSYGTDNYYNWSLLLVIQRRHFLQPNAIGFSVF